MKKYFLLVAVLVLFTACQKDFRFGKYRSEKGYEYEILPDSTILFNGQIGGYSSSNKGIVKIYNRKIKGKIANYYGEKTTRTEYHKITNFGLAEDSATIMVVFHFIKDSAVCNKIDDRKYEVRVKDTDSNILDVSGRKNDSVIMMKIPSVYNKIQLTLLIDHCYVFYHDISIYGCYNYCIDLYYNLGFSEYDVQGMSDITFFRRKDYIFTVLGKKKITKYYFVEDEKTNHKK